MLAVQHIYGLLALSYCTYKIQVRASFADIDDSNSGDGGGDD